MNKFTNGMYVTVADVENYAKEIGKTKQEVFQMILDTFVAGGVGRGEGLYYMNVFKKPEYVFGVFRNECTWAACSKAYLREGQIDIKLNIRDLLGASDTPPEHLLKDGVRVWFKDGECGIALKDVGASNFYVLFTDASTANFENTLYAVTKLTYMGETLWEKPKKKRVLTLQEIADKFGVDVDDLVVEGL